MLLDLFDLIWDILPDWMHIIKGIWGHLVKQFKGDRAISKPEKPSTTHTVRGESTDWTTEEMKERNAKYLAKMENYLDAIRVQAPTAHYF